MALINRVFLVGNLTRDIEAHSLNSGGRVYNMGLAVNERRKNKSGEYEEFPVFVDLTMFDSVGSREWMVPYLLKGTKVSVEGRLRFDTWNDKVTNEKRSKLYVVVDSIEADWPKKGDGQPRQQRQQQAQAQHDVYDDDDSIPF